MHCLITGSAFYPWPAHPDPLGLFESIVAALQDSGDTGISALPSARKWIAPPPITAPIPLMNVRRTTHQETKRRPYLHYLQSTNAGLYTKQKGLSKSGGTRSIDHPGGQ